MCFANPAKSLELARSRLTPEQWARFEREFNDFCVVHGLPGVCEGETRTLEERIETQAKAMAFTWAKWAFFQGRAEREFYREGRRSQESRCWYVMTDEQAQLSWDRWGAFEGNQRVASAHFERIGLAMMDDEQAVASLERWKEGK